MKTIKLLSTCFVFGGILGLLTVYMLQDWLTVQLFKEFFRL